MPATKRIKTKYPGVYYIESTVPGTNKPDKIFYIMYRRNAKLIEEKAGRQSTDDMTPARASAKRTARIEGKQLSNTSQRNANKGKWTVNRIWEEYKLQKTDLKGLRQDKNRYKLYLETKLGGKEPSQIIQLDIDRLRIKLLKTKSPQTVKHILALLRRIINFGFSKGLCPPLSFKIEIPKVDNCKTDDLNPDQLKTLLKAIKKSTHIIAASMMLTALYSGIRRGEMFKLQWKDIDFDRGFIHLRDPKGKISQKIPLNDPKRQVFEAMPRTSVYVFPGADGKQRTDINKAVNKIKTVAGLPKDFRPLHGLRHVYASMLASSGQVDMYTLQKLMTHKSPQMTQRYAHLRDDALKAASDLAGDIISEAMNQSSKKQVPISKKAKD
jgi:integrase